MIKNTTPGQIQSPEVLARAQESASQLLHSTRILHEALTKFIDDPAFLRAVHHQLGDQIKATLDKIDGIKPAPAVPPSYEELEAAVRGLVKASNLNPSAPSCKVLLQLDAYQADKNPGFPSPQNFSDQHPGDGSPREMLQPSRPWRMEGAIPEIKMPSPGLERSRRAIQDPASKLTDPLWNGRGSGSAGWGGGSEDQKPRDIGGGGSNEGKGFFVWDQSK